MSERIVEYQGLSHKSAGLITKQAWREFSNSKGMFSAPYGHYSSLVVGALNPSCSNFCQLGTASYFSLLLFDAGI
jgi:hypothetical protein